MHCRVDFLLHLWGIFQSEIRGWTNFPSNSWLEGTSSRFPPHKKPKLLIFHQSGRTHADISSLGHLMRRLCGSEMLPGHVLFIFIIPHGPYMVKNPESAPPPWTGWIFLQVGQCQAVSLWSQKASKHFKSGAEHARGGNWATLKTMLGKRQWGEGINEKVAIPEKPRHTPELRDTGFVHKWHAGILSVYLRHCNNFCVRCASGWSSEFWLPF